MSLELRQLKEMEYEDLLLHQLGPGGDVHQEGVMRGGGIGGKTGTSIGERGRVYLYSMVL